MTDHFHRPALSNLEESRRLAARRGMHVQRVEGRRRTLRRKFRRGPGELPQILHLLFREQQVGVGPAFDALPPRMISRLGSAFPNFTIACAPPTASSTSTMPH